MSTPTNSAPTPDPVPTGGTIDSDPVVSKPIAPTPPVVATTTPPPQPPAQANKKYEVLIGCNWKLKPSDEVELRAEKGETRSDIPSAVAKALGPDVLKEIM
jgi:hypothetical protein